MPTIHPPSPFEDSLALLLKAVRSGRNTLIVGPPGAGKTALARATSQQSGFELKYFNAATLDPFADLLGIPVPVGPDHDKQLLFLRPAKVASAEIIFFDDLNRAPPRVLNAVFELIQFRSINGDPLPRLRAVIAAINPSSPKHRVEELNPALIDRFHLFLRFEGGPSRDWFLTTFGQRIGEALLDWYYTDLNPAQRVTLSNRRLEYLAQNLRDEIDPQLAVPLGTELPLACLLARATEARDLLKIEDFVRNPASFAHAVAQDIRVATRFSQLWPMMRPAQKCQVKELILDLHPEALAAARANTPFVIAHTIEAIRKTENHGEATAFEALLQERISLLSPRSPPASRQTR